MVIDMTENLPPQLLRGEFLSGDCNFIFDLGDSRRVPCDAFGLLTFEP